MVESTGSKNAVPTPRDQTEPIASAEQEADRIRGEDRPLGRPGRPMNRRSAFFVGVTGTTGALAAVLVAYLVVLASDVLILVLLAFFIAVGLHPAVTYLARHRVPEGVATALVSVAMVALLAGFLVAAIVPLIEQADELVVRIGNLSRTLNDEDSMLGRINRQFDLDGMMGGTPTVGKAALEGVTSTFVVLVLSIYFLADFRRIRGFLYRLVPAGRRPRAILLGDQIYARIGAFVLGNMFVSLISGLVTFVCLTVFGVPYALFLAIMVAVLDLVPVIGTMVAAVVVVAVALTVSVPVCLGVLAVLIVYKVIEDYLLMPKVIGRAVSVPAVVTVLAVLVGGALAGVLGALVSIPVAAAVLLVLHEVSIPWLDRT